MGYIHYGEHHIYRFDDLTLAHLRYVITSKLLQQESFVFTWLDSGLQYSIWLHPTSSLVFEFESAQVVELDRALLESLMGQANSPNGLRLPKHFAEKLAAAKAASELP